LGIGDGDDVRDHVEIDSKDVRDDIEEYKADTSAGDTVEVGIDSMSAPIVKEEIVEIAGEDSSYLSCTRDGIVRSFKDMPIDLDDAVRDFYHHMSDVRIDRIVGIETVQRRLEADQLIAKGQRVSMIERIKSLRLENLKAENQSQNGSNGNNGNGDNGDGENGNGENGNGGNGNPNENGRGKGRSCQVDKCTNLIMETELWNLTVKNNALAAYTQRFQELTMMCTKMAPEEEDRVDKFIRGLPDNIQGNVIAAEPTRLQDVIRIANNLMDQKLKGYAVKNAENKRRLEVNLRDNCGQQPPFKRPNVGGQNMARAYTAGNNEKKPYNGLLPLCNKCKLHHEGPCTVRCRKCNKVGHLTRDCKVTIFTTST
ncbi:putative reverse transcriptase domain-containing protein, partial [Tanacetum coccineum]